MTQILIARRYAVGLTWRSWNAPPSSLCVLSATKQAAVKWNFQRAKNSAKYVAFGLVKRNMEQLGHSNAQERSGRQTRRTQIWRWRHAMLEKASIPISAVGRTDSNCCSAGAGSVMCACFVYRLYFATRRLKRYFLRGWARFLIHCLVTVSGSTTPGLFHSSPDCRQ